MQKEVSCIIMRGGTSKGVFFEETNIPAPGEKRDQFLLRVMGSPDLRQIDGLGGATSTTSKVAIIAKSNREDADVDYTFAQVSIDKPLVDYKGNCGNISSAVGPYALEMGHVEAGEGESLVRIYNTNTGKIILSRMQTPGRRVSYSGDFAIAGVPGTAAPVVLQFGNPAGAVTGTLLPTGKVVDHLHINGLGDVQVSIVDVSNPLVFVQAKEVGLQGTELPDQIDSSQRTLDLLEEIRGRAAEMLGFVDNWQDAAAMSPAVPKMTIVSPPQTCTTVNGASIDSSACDLTGRMMSMQKTHKTYALTGALCTAAAAVIPGTVVNQVIRRPFDAGAIRIVHPGGLIPVGVEYRIHADDSAGSEDSAAGLSILSASGYRTARLLMKGTVYY